MDLETLFMMGGMLLTLGGLAMWSQCRIRARGARGRLFVADAVALPPKRVERP